MMEMRYISSVDAARRIQPVKNFGINSALPDKWLCSEGNRVSIQIYFQRVTDDTSPVFQNRQQQMNKPIEYNEKRPNRKPFSEEIQLLVVYNARVGEI